tara:strand:- start:10 stop:243 length:234 start_codon:yes stop_codon:yes gene_type:complete
MTKKPAKSIQEHLGNAIRDVNDLEDQLEQGHRVLDDINVPKWDDKGNKMLLHERLSIHREQITDHLVKLRGLLDKYR